MSWQSPNFFQIFEAATFVYIFIFALWIFLRKEKPKESTIILLIAIGLIALVFNLFRLIFA